MINLLNNIHVINLNRSPDRLKNIKQNLAKYNIKFNRFEAIDGSKLTDADISNNTTLLCRNVLCSRSIIGCALSHISIWKSISLLPDIPNNKFHIILEDDSRFTDKTIEYFESLAKSPLVTNPETADLIINFICTGALCTGTNHPANKDFVSPILPFGLAGYLITKGAATKLYKYFSTNKVSYHIDFVLAHIYDDLDITYMVNSNGILELDQVDNANSTNFSPSPFAITKFFDFIGLSKLSWFLSTSVCTIKLSFSINLLIILFFVLLVLNITKFNNLLIYLYLLTEFLMWVSGSI